MSEDVTRWLQDLGLGQHASAFEENAIVWSLLPKLNHELLKDIGIKAVGHRMKILDAVAEFEFDRSHLKPEIDQPIATGEAERRQLTVMFCDLAGSTELSQNLDPEQLRDVNRAYQEACAGVVTRLEGVVAKYMGDGILIYFGYPQAHEDDAERAVRAGLGILEAVRRLEPLPGLPLEVRVGVATC